MKLESALKKSNEKIWDMGEKIRELGDAEIFNQEFSEVAHGIHISNDVRAAIKKKSIYSSDLQSSRKNLTNIGSKLHSLRKGSVFIFKILLSISVIVPIHGLVQYDYMRDVSEPRGEIGEGGIRADNDTAF